MKNEWEFSRKQPFPTAEEYSILNRVLYYGAKSMLAQKKNWKITRDIFIGIIANRTFRRILTTAPESLSLETFKSIY